MKPKEIKVELIEIDADTDILRFHIDENHFDVNLNSAECQSSLKSVFAALLNVLINEDVNLELSVGAEYSRVMYKEVCTEYIKDLNRELEDIKGKIRSEIL